MIHPAFTIPVDCFTDLRFKEPLTDGQYTLGIRPEDVLTTLQAGLFQTEVKSVELIGRERILNFDLADKHMKSIVSIEENHWRRRASVIWFSLQKSLYLWWKRRAGLLMFKKNYNPENQPKAWLFLLPSLVIIFLFSVYRCFVPSSWVSKRNLD